MRSSPGSRHIERTDGGKESMAVKEFDTKIEKASAPLTKELPRRAFLLKLGFVLNGIAGVFVGVPVLGYLLSAFRNDGGFTSWIALGSLDSFAENQTRLPKFRHPYTRPVGGQTGDLPCWGGRGRV